MSQAVVGLYCAYALVSAIALLALKAGLAQPGFRLSLSSVLSFDLPYPVIGGVLLYVVSFLLWLAILRASAVSVAFPVAVGLVQVFLLAGSSLVLHQRPTVPAVVGSAIIVAGICVVGLR